MAGDKRKSGLELVGDVPWGTHFCQFYETKEDLADILVPYFRAGLENNEFCMWVTSEPLTVKDVHAAMEKTLPGYRRYLEKGQIEVIPYSEWYVIDGAFDADRVLAGWVEKLNGALARGFDGLRLTGNTFWLEKRDWDAFTAYEEAVNTVIGRYRMIALCTYSLDRCAASEVIDVVNNHQFALIKRNNKWESMVSYEGKRADEALRESERRYRSLFDAMTEGFGLHEIICDAKEEPIDYRFIDVNHAFEQLTGLKREDVVGRTAREVLPNIESYWIEAYGKVALTGEPIHIERPSASLGRSYEVFAYSPAPRQFAALFVDATERREMTVELARLASFPRLNPNPIIEMNLSGKLQYANPAAVQRFPELGSSGSRPLVLETISSMAEEMQEGDKDLVVRELGAGGRWYQVAGSLLRSESHVRAYLVDITDRRRMEEALRRSNENLEQFAYAASHDLQEPLRIMANYSQLLKQRYGDRFDSDASDFTDYIVEAAKRMQTLISDLLAYSRAASLDTPVLEIDVERVVDEVIRGMARTIEETGATITRDRLPSIKANATALRQLFQNLIGNAVKFRSDDPPLVHISARRNENEWVFSVRDNGIGIDAAYKDRIFLVFQRLHGRDEYPGTGIGLAICKRLVEGHGGRIWVDSEPHKGSTFNFTVPTREGNWPISREGRPS
jgi:PAS domain S-box-containing protein